MSLDYHVTDRGVELAAVPDFDLGQTLDCGQCFRWEKLSGGLWRGAACGRVLTLSEEGDFLLFHGVTEEEFQSVWVPYFDLSLDYRSVRAELAKKHETLACAARFAPGIHILRQEPWEALCSFIVSQNNNIPRIKGIIARLCENFGGAGDGRIFPGPERLAGLTPDDLAPLRCGFRARYLISAARKVADGEVDLAACAVLPEEEARTMLTAITGVGVKVADCTMLYGLHRLDAFPMDVWMKRAMEVLFPGCSPRDFGEYAGIAQQYIFHYSRCHPELFRTMEKEPVKKTG